MNASLDFSPPARIPGRALAIVASALLHLLALLALPAAMRSGPQPASSPLLRVSILPISARMAPPSSRAESAPAPPARAAERTRAKSSPAREAARPHSTDQSRAGKPAASAGKGEPRVTLEGLRQQMRRLEPENPNAKPLREDPEKARLARGIDRAERADCKRAYAGLGLLAAPMLLKDAFDKDNGCKW
ncbi:hypothetical protein [Chromobacterium violaceum]|uniref:Uncharacterized protein n=1 Tax=Chromobacterium violaceum TaxID=536 RepID=A0A202BFG3_CHRVL|nr:hypothetical protein [Chromobacterium violaceum]MBP4046858.1 hypothetical protein [Chromobacterium violaceum]OVE50293.1 hypothetical protein CBW21_03345 [Chromobacterium violaceum]